MLKCWRNPVVWAKTLQVALLCTVALGMLGAVQSRYERLGHQLVCQCGCGQILVECNHVGCPISPKMINELQAQLGTGLGDTGIFNWFVAKYGAIVLAAPIRGGFDNVAWIMPIAVFVLATLGTFAIVWFWKRRAGTLTPAAPYGSPAGAVSHDDAALRERIRRETEY
jgi:cytochrome c-type biogenesis protein CcmH/NrfF